MNGTIVVNEKFVFRVVDLDMRDGKITFIGRLDGPCDPLEPGDQQVIMYGDDGSECFRARVHCDGWERLDENGTAWWGQPLGVEWTGRSGDGHGGMRKVSW